MDVCHGMLALAPVFDAVFWMIRMGDWMEVDCASVEL